MAYEQKYNNNIDVIEILILSSGRSSQRSSAADAKKIRELEQELVRSRAKLQDVEAKKAWGRSKAQFKKKVAIQIGNVATLPITMGYHFVQLKFNGTLGDPLCRPYH